MKRHKQSLFVVGILAVFIFSTSALAGEVQGVGPNHVEIGSFMAITGIIARTTMEAEAGVRSYLNFVNENGGVNGREIVLRLEDDGYSETKALLAAKKLVTRDKVFVLFNTFGTAPTMATIPYIVRTGIPFIAPGAGAKELYEPLKKNIFGGSWGIYNNHMEILITYLVKDLGFKKIAYFYYGDEAGKSQRVNVVAQMKKLGLELVADSPFERGTTNFGAYLTKLKQSDPEAVVVYSSTPDLARIIKQGDEMGFHPQWSSHLPASDRIIIDLAGKSSEGLIGASPLLPVTSDDPAVAQYRDLLKKYYPHVKPGMWGMLGYGGAKILVEILKRTGKDLSWENVIKAAETMKDWKIGIGPPITYTSKSHVGNNGVVIVKVENGEFKPQTGWLTIAYAE